MKVHLKKNSYTFCFDRYLYRFLELFVDYETADKIASKFHAPLLDHIINKPFEIFNEDVIIIDYYDTWNCDSTLSKLIVPLIKHFRSTLNGCPCALDLSDVPLEVRLIKSDSDIPDNMPAWEWILDEIIWSFEQTDSDWDDQFFTPNPPIDTEYGPGTSYNFDREGYEKYQKRIQKGHILLGKYLQSIWN